MRSIGNVRTLSAFLICTLALGSTGCTSNCDNAGVSVDGNGNIVVKGENGFVSPNSTILKNVTNWPAPPQGEQNLAFSQGYTLSRDRAFYLLANTAQHPNLVYRISLETGKATPLGSENGDVAAAGLLDEGGADAASKETSIAADNEYVYSVDQTPVISRASLFMGAKLTPFIAGERTKLRSPIGVAVGGDGKVCALDSETLLVLCYAASAHGSVAPIQSIDTKAVLGYGQVDAISFGHLGQLVVAGTSDASGVKDFAIAVFDLSGSIPRLLRTIGGPATQLQFPDSIGVDGAGNILVLQGNADVVAFGPGQHGNTAPISVRDPAATVSHPFRLAINRSTGDIAILGSDGIAFFSKAANNLPSKWPAEERRLPLRGWDVAFGARSLIVANQFGTPVAYALQEALNESSVVRSSVLDLHDPEFISTDQTGRVYVASTDGVITALPGDSKKMAEAETVSFRTPFGRNASAFAVDSAGYYYLSSTSNNAIVVVGPDGRQSVLAGNSTGLNRPIGLAVGKDGTVFVANSEDKNILEFTRGSSGDVAPLGRIEGSSTGLVAPQALAIDPSGKLYVFDGPVTAGGSGASHYVRVYDAESRGNVSPLKSYPVRTKCWVNAP